jgi:hypothetical protein
MRGADSAQLRKGAAQSAYALVRVTRTGVAGWGWTFIACGFEISNIFKFFNVKIQFWNIKVLNIPTKGLKY